ncbi:MAG: ATP-binding protein [Asticcacaulis sp.]
MPPIASKLVEDTPVSPMAEPVAEGRDIDFGRVCKSVCELSAALFDVPMTIVKLYQGNTLITRGTLGIAQEQQIEDLSFCQRKLIPGESLLLPDATADARFFLEAAVLNAPKIRFYVDIPLVSDGVVLGVLALCERQPRHDFNGAKLNLLRQYANQAATLIALAQGTTQRTGIITELKSQQTRFDLAQDMTGIGYWSIDLKTRELTWSKGLYAVYGLSPKSYKPRVATQLDIYEPQDQALIIDKFQRAVNYGEDFDFNVEILRRKDKLARTIRTKGGVEYGDDGKPERLCAVVRDITDGVSDQEEVIRARMAAEDINDAKNDFLAQITTELKTPLNNILGYARLLNEQRHDDPDVAGYVQGLLKSAKAMQSLVKETLDVSAMDSALLRDPGHAHSSEEAVNIVNLVRDAVNQFSAQAAASQTRINAHFVDIDNAWGQLDSMRLRQVLQNLIGNACKFTRGGLINVTASQVRVDDATWLRVSVRDTGIGMTEEQSHGLFSGRSQGLGLSVTKAIIDLLGGHIGVVSRQGEGSNFWFEIPVSWVEAPARAETAPRILRAPADPMRQTPASQPHTAPVSGYAAPTAARNGAASSRLDDDRFNREYLRALLQDMKLDIQ